MMRFGLSLGCACGALAAAIGAGPASAQVTPAAAPEGAAATQNNQPAAAQPDSGLGEIVVTATRRATNLQTTPIAVSAVDQKLIAQSSPRNIGDLAEFVPNFSAAKLAGFNAASFSIRGASTNSIIVYFEPPVAVLVDDFVVPSVQTQLLDTFDVAQVEVLRGPQGTLFGKNTTGGAVVVKTIRPVLDEISVQGRLQVGRFGTVIPQTAVNIPIGSTMAFRGVISHTGTSGYYHDGGCFGPVQNFNAPGVNTVGDKFAGRSGCGDGRALGGEDVWNGRAKLLWEPNSRFTALAQYEFLRDHSETVPAVNITPNSNSFLFYSLGVGSQANVNSNPLDNAAVTNRQGDLITEGTHQSISVNGAYLNMDYKTDIGTISSVSGYRFQASRLPNTYMGSAPVAADGTVLSLFDAQRDDDRRTWQQELRFASSFAGPVQFVAGGFYQHDDTTFCVAQLLGFEDLVAPPTPYGPWNNTPYILCNAQKGHSVAAYAEGTYKITPKLIFTAGGRYTWEHKTWYGRQQVFAQQLTGGTTNLGNALDANVFAYPAGVVQVQDNSKDPTWRFSLGWQATPTIYTYATYSRGFKAGGFNDQIGSFHPFRNADGTDNQQAFAAAAAATKPERADSYEAGVKTQFLDNHLRFDLTGFYVKYTDLQRQIVVPLIVNGQQFQVTTFFNAAAATVKGIEAEATAIPVSGLTLRGVLGYQDGKYNSYVTPIPAGYDLATSPLDRTPKWQWTLDANYEIPLGKYKLDFNVDANYVAKNLDTQSITSPDQNTYLNARTLLNASITVAQIDDKYYLRAVGRNLTNKLYMVSSQDVAGLWADAQYGEPRYFGAEFGFKFGGRR